MNVNREPCSWCGGFADPASVCPRSIACPVCKGTAGGPCYAPSGHRRDQLHKARIQLAESSTATQEDTMHTQITLDGREEIRATPATFVQSGLFDVAPTSTGDGDAPELVAGQLDTAGATHEPMRPRGVRRCGEWS